MRLPFERKLLLFFGFIFIAILILGGISYKNNQSFLETNNLVEHTENVLYEAEQVLSIAKDLGARGYTLTGDSSFLETYIKAKVIVFNHIRQLKALTADNPKQQERIHVLDSIMRERVNLSETAILLKNENKFDDANQLPATKEAKMHMDRIRQLMSDIRDEENTLLLLRKEDSEKNVLAFNRTFATMLFAIVALLAASYYTIRYNLAVRSRAEERLRYQSYIVSNASDAIIASDTQFKTTLWNKRAEETYGYLKEETIGRNAMDVLKVEYMLPDTHESSIRQIAEKGEWSGEVIHHAKNGQKIVVLSSVSTIKDKNGKDIGFISINRDIRERKKAEEEIRNSNHFLDAILENIPDMIFVKDANELRFVRFNKAGEKLLGYSRSDLIGKNDFDFFPKEEADSFTRKDRQVLEGGRMVDIFEEPIHTKDGEQWLHTKKLPLTDVDGNPSYLLGISEVITERKLQGDKIKELNKSLEKNILQLQQANKDLESFTYSASHDLAALRIIDGYVELLVGECGEKINDEGRRMLQIITTNARRMGQLIDDLLDLSRIGKKELTLYKVNMEELIKPVLEEQLAVSSSKKVNVKINSLEHVNCDGNLIRQVWANLISNALKYSRNKKNPVIEIGSEKKEGEVVYFVKDNGVGFDMQYADKLFGVFQRLHKMTEFEGTGVGLAIVNRIIAKHSGRVWADAGIDTGAVFYFSIPAN